MNTPNFEWHKEANDFVSETFLILRTHVNQDRLILLQIILSLILIVVFSVKFAKWVLGYFAIPEAPKSN